MNDSKHIKPRTFSKPIILSEIEYNIGKNCKYVPNYMLVLEYEIFSECCIK